MAARRPDPGRSAPFLLHPKADVAGAAMCHHEAEQSKILPECMEIRHAPRQWQFDGWLGTLGTALVTLYIGLR